MTTDYEVMAAIAAACGIAYGTPAEVGLGLPSEQIDNSFLWTASALSREERRRLWHAYAIAGAITADPAAALAHAIDQHAGMRSDAEGARWVHWWQEWERLLTGRVDELLGALTDLSPYGQMLRSHHPFSGLISDPAAEAVESHWLANDG